MTEPAVLMVAPNGARRGKADHPALPLTIAETVAEARAAVAAGASVLHAHVRGEDGAHVLDAGLYRELLSEVASALPGLPVQITTEAVGRYSPAEQAALLSGLEPAFASVALRELAAEDLALARRAYHAAAEAGVAIQHILYDAADLRRLHALRHEGVIPAGPAALIFVLGRYAGDGLGRPADLDAFLTEGTARGDRWWCCAFGGQENACMARALGAGGHARIGFENNLWRRDGSVAASNADLVAEAAEAAVAAGRPLAGFDEARALLSCDKTT